MAEKRRFTVSVPDHVANAIEDRAKPLGATPTEYAADVLRWWFGQGCPPVTHDETALLAASIASRIKPIPPELNALALDSKHTYQITDDKVVLKLLTQLGMPNLFAASKEHDEVRMMTVFDNHPSHWIQVDFFKGTKKKGGDGFSFSAYPKISCSRSEMSERVRRQMKEMEAKGPFEFSQIPMFEKTTSGNQTPTGVHASS